MEKSSITIWCEKYGIKPKGVIHVGGCLGEEREEWAGLTSKVVWFEANPALWEPLEKNVLKLGHEVVRAAVGGRCGTVNLNVSNAYMSSSILPLGRHAEQYPSIIYTETVEVPMVTLDAALEGRYQEFDFLAMDVQGYEGEVLMGTIHILPHIKWIHAEYNEAEMYQGCWLLPQLTAWLKEQGFALIETRPIDTGWGDCLFERENV